MIYFLRLILKLTFLGCNCQRLLDIGRSCIVWIGEENTRENQDKGVLALCSHNALTFEFSELLFPLLGVLEMQSCKCW